MLEPLQIGEALQAEMVRGRGFGDLLDPRGTFHVQHIRDGAVIDEWDVPNGVTNAAKNALLNAFFNQGTTYSAWYIGLVDNSGFTTFSTTDVMNSHAGWNEFTAYSVGSADVTHRGTWGQGNASGQAVTNATALTFTFTAGGTVQGIFVVTDGTKSGNIGLLWSTAPFNSTLSVLSGDQLKVTYTVQL